jgi:6-phosphogluconolactonase (cycloisomerase 2 family)
VLSLGAEPTYSSLSRDGRYLFVANYSGATDPGGTLAVLPLGRKGALQTVTQIKTHRASMVDPARQLAPHVHSVVSSPDGRFVFAQDLGADRIYVYAYDPAQPEAPLAALSDQPWVALTPGSGPRHLVFSADGRHAYVTLEMAGAVAVFDHAGGHLTLRQTLLLAPAGFVGRVGAGALHLSPDGRFLIVADRGTDNSLITFAVDPATGALQPAGRRAVEGEEPREFTLDQSGRFVIVANQHSHAVVLFRRDPANGQIGDRLQTLALDDAADVKLVD